MSEWTEFGREPELSDLLSDPIVQALMVSDRTQASDVEHLIERIRAEVPRVALAAR